MNEQIKNEFKDPYEFIRCEERAWLKQKALFERAKIKQMYYIK